MSSIDVPAEEPACVTAGSGFLRQACGATCIQTSVLELMQKARLELALRSPPSSLRRAISKALSHNRAGEAAKQCRDNRMRRHQIRAQVLEQQKSKDARSRYKPDGQRQECFFHGRWASVHRPTPDAAGVFSALSRAVTAVLARERMPTDSSISFSVWPVTPACQRRIPIRAPNCHGFCSTSPSPAPRPPPQSPDGRRFGPGPRCAPPSSECETAMHPPAPREIRPD